MDTNDQNQRFSKTKRILSKLRIPAKLTFFLVGALSLIWFLVRVIPKPSRATYPCMRTAAPWASAFVIYILGLSATAFSYKRFLKNFRELNYRKALMFLVAGIGFSLLVIPLNQMELLSKPVAIIQANDLEEPNSPMGTARGIFPGRVVWVYDADATDENCPNTWNNAYFMDQYTDQAVVDDMIEKAVLRLTEKSSVEDAWNDIFIFHNQERGKGSVAYQAGEKIFIKINATSSWGGNFNTGDLSRVNNSNYAISETSPQVVTTVLRHLTGAMHVAESDIYIGDPMKHIYKDNYEKWHAEFPDVHYLDNSSSYGSIGREGVVASGTAVIDYSDRGTVLREGDWSSAEVGNPVNTDFLYTIFEDMEYMINLPTLKGHVRAGVTMFAKNHFGSHTRSDAKHLHGGLVDINSDGSNRRTEYEMYRVQVDLMSHELLGKKNLIYLMDALYTSEHEVNKPDKWQKAPWNNDWTSSIFISQDPVAIESVGFDMLYYEFDGTNGLDAFPHYGAVDDYLHQAADEANWPAGIVYDPENDGTKIPSLGVHEHWNNADEMLYTRNLGTGEGIELVKAGGADIPFNISTENSELPSNQVNVVYVDSALTAWIGTDKGLSRLSAQGVWSLYNKEDHLLNNMVNDLAYEYASPDKQLWVATDSGLTVVSYNNYSGLTAATTYVPENSSLAGAGILAVSVDMQHNRWVGTDSALSVFRESDWATERNGIDAMGLSFNFYDYKITDIEAYDFADMALISTEGKGVLRMAYDDIDGFTGASTYGQPWAAVNSDNFTSIAVDGELQWYGTDVGAYSHPSEDTKAEWNLFNLDSGLLDMHVTATLIDSRGDIWIGTYKGLSVLTGNGWYKYNLALGMLHEEVNSLCEDVSGIVWVGTNGGIQRFDGVPGVMAIPSHPQLILPANGRTLAASPVELDWAAVVGADNYRLELSNVQDFNTLLVDEDGIAASTYSFSSGEDLATYYWHVKAVNGLHESRWSETRSFSMDFSSGIKDNAVPGYALSIYPVPVIDHLNIYLDITRAGLVELVIYDLQGKALFSKIYAAQGGTGSFRIDTDMAGLNSGSYILRVMSAEGSLTRKFIVK